MHHVSAIANTDAGKSDCASSQQGPIRSGAFVRDMLCTFPKVSGRGSLLTLLQSRLTCQVLQAAWRTAWHPGAELALPMLHPFFLSFTPQHC